MPATLTKTELLTKVALSLALLAAVMMVCALVGAQKISIHNILAGPGAHAGDNIDYEIFTGIRLPRVILAAIVGAALACSGVVLQAILRNPLAEPYILGISSGAGLGAIIAVLSGISWTFWGGSPVSIFAFVMSLATVWLVWFTAHFAAKTHSTALLLAGVVVNAFFAAMIMFLTSIARSEQLRTTIYWLMGNLTEKSWSVLAFGSVCIMSGTFVLIGISHQLNAVALGEEQARALGVNATRIKVIALACTAFITAVAVSLSGLIGFVGLIVPHAVRMVFGPDHRLLMPLSAVTAAIFLVVADTFARTAFGQEQLPVGIITAIAGGPFFLVILAQYSRKVGQLK